MGADRARGCVSSALASCLGKKGPVWGVRWLVWRPQWPGMERVPGACKLCERCCVQVKKQS